jgi:hypothetical protein
MLGFARMLLGPPLDGGGAPRPAAKSCYGRATGRVRAYERNLNIQVAAKESNYKYEGGDRVLRCVG